MAYKNPRKQSAHVQELHRQTKEAKKQHSVKPAKSIFSYIKRLFVLLLLLLSPAACQKPIDDVACKTCSTTIVGPGINRSYSNIVCGDELKNVKQGQEYWVIDGVLCLRSTYCK